MIVSLQISMNKMSMNKSTIKKKQIFFPSHNNKATRVGYTQKKNFCKKSWFMVFEYMYYYFLIVWYNKTINLPFLLPIQYLSFYCNNFLLHGTLKPKRTCIKTGIIVHDFKTVWLKHHEWFIKSHLMLFFRVELFKITELVMHFIMLVVTIYLRNKKSWYLLFYTI